ncbi:MAG: hypothetical protein FWC34_01920 [Bacteroidetes bacterium]|nr:hypothetical protein [Bacteroidota bacterium]MCL2303181.1 hypothetical protein [Lentimicrobiaceae bacterium]
MKKKLRVLSFFALSVSLMFSCSKYNNMLDIDWEYLEVDGDMNWGIPLINAEYSIEKILNEFGNLGFIKYEPNGDYYFEYAVPPREYLNAETYNNLPEKTQLDVFDFLEANPHYTGVDLSTEDMRVHRATIKSGEFWFQFPASVSLPSDINYDIRVESDEIFNADGTPFVLYLSKSNSTGKRSAAGLKIITPDSRVNFTITVILTADSPDMENLIINSQIDLLNIKFLDAEVETLKELTHPFDAATEFSIFPQNISLNAIIHNPRLSLDVTNTFGTTAKIMITKAYLKGGAYTTSVLKEDNKTITIPENHIGTVDITEHIKTEILLNSAYNSIDFECIAILPAGRIFVRDNSVVATGMSFYVPFDLTIEEATFNDTLAFNLPGLSNLSFLDVVTMRTAFSSSIPSNFNVQIWLYNSKTQTVVDSLLPAPMKINGSYTGDPVQTAPQYVHITDARIRRLQQADKIILHLSLNTNSQHKCFNRENSLQARLGAHIKVAN